MCPDCESLNCEVHRAMADCTGYEAVCKDCGYSWTIDLTSTNPGY